MSSSLLEYDRPALDWEREGLPLGNGRLGAMVLGPPERAELWFNELSLWTGGENPAGEYDDDFGNYQAFGRLSLELEGLGAVGQYSRRLDLATGVLTTRFEAADGSGCTLEALASHPADVLAVCLRTTRTQGFSGRIGLESAHAAPVRGVGGSGLVFDGVLANGLEYHAEVLARAEPGALAVEGTKLGFSGCQSVLLLLGAGTSYRCDPARGFRGEAPAPRVRQLVERALALGWDALRAHHVEDHARLFSRVSVDFGTSSSDVRSQPIDRRLERYQPAGDPELVATLFQYGRYLLIASSRPGGLPANLQGLWNRVNHPPWHSDYHTNINTQMNYWPAEPANLSECHEPLFDLLDAMLPACRAATRSAFGESVRGFTYRTSHNVFGGQGWEWNTPASAWYALHYFEHFAFGGDRRFLAERAWPYLREVSEFWLGRLKARDDGTLVAPEGWSPEHGPREDGVTYDQELVRELFVNTLLIARALSQDDDPLVADVRAAEARLLAPKIGRFGQLQEWESDRDDPEDRHRHCSHLVGVYPGARISRLRTPELAQAAEVSLRARGDSGDSRRSWTWPWRCAIWARLRTRDCQRMIDGYIQHNLLPNLIATHPPLQLDGSFGITAALAEMLVQSHEGSIELLPGVDLENWPNGSFQGLCARGGFEVSAVWENQRLLRAELLARLGGPVELGAPENPRAIRDETGKALTFAAARSKAVRFETRAGGRYRVHFAE